MEFVPESLLYECIYNRIYTDILCQTRASTFIQLKPAVCCYSNYIFVQLRDRNRIEANKKKYNDEEKRSSRIYRRLEESVCVYARCQPTRINVEMYVRDVHSTFILHILHYSTHVILLMMMTPMPMTASFCRSFALSLLSSIGLSFSHCLHERSSRCFGWRCCCSHITLFTHHLYAIQNESISERLYVFAQHFLYIMIYE